MCGSKCHRGLRCQYRKFHQYSLPIDERTGLRCKAQLRCLTPESRRKIVKIKATLLIQYLQEKLTECNVSQRIDLVFIY